MKSNFVTDNTKSLEKRNAHFYSCQRENRPYVYVATSGKSAWVELDMFTTNRNLDDATRDQIFEAMVEHGISPRDTLCAHVICRAAKVPLSIAQSLASRIFEIADKAIPRLKHFAKDNEATVF